MDRPIVPAEIRYLDKVTDFVDKRLDPFGTPERIRLQIRLAVEEIFVNIASYAYEAGPGEAEIICETFTDPARIRIRFIDSGIPFDPLEKEDADTSEDALLSRVGGLGILLVKNTMDETEYIRENGQNILTLIKRL